LSTSPHLEKARNAAWLVQEPATVEGNRYRGSGWVQDSAKTINLSCSENVTRRDFSGFK
jgi:hypothetical protein